MKGSGPVQNNDGSGSGMPPKNTDPQHCEQGYEVTKRYDQCLLEYHLDYVPNATFSDVEYMPCSVQKSAKENPLRSLGG